MTGQQEFLAELVTVLDRCDIPYMITGSVASSFHGEPRATRDVDVVVELDRSRTVRLLAGFNALDWYVSETAMAEAVARRSTFNVIDPGSGWKADLVVRSDRPYSREEFGRRVSVPLLGEGFAPVSIIAVEDSILSKLEWHAQSSAEQQFRDAVAVGALHRADLDAAYLRRWADDLGVRETLEQVLRESE